MKKKRKKKKLQMCQLYSYLKKKTPEQHLLFLLLNLSIFYSTVIITGFEQINAGWVSECIVSGNKHVFSNRYYIVLWARKSC